MHSSTIAELKPYLEAEWYALDVETLALYSDDPHDLRCVQFAAPGLEPLFYDLHSMTEEEVKLLREYVKLLSGTFYIHNAIFDLRWLRLMDLIPGGSCRCTMIMARLITMGLPNVSVSLKNVALRYLKKEVNKELQKSDWSGFLTPEQKLYALEDVQLVVELVPILESNLATAKLEVAAALEYRTLLSIVDMELNGLPFDDAKLRELHDDMIRNAFNEREAFLETMDAQLPEEHKLPRLITGEFNEDKKKGFNIGSPKQMVDKLTILLGKPPLDPATGKPSASKGALREYAADNLAIYHYLNWKRCDKYATMATSLADAISGDGCVHASYLQLGADTGRFSCREPNLQQVPRLKQFRDAAVAPEGWSFVVADYSQLELRLVAMISRDPVMIDAFMNGDDLHAITARQIYGVDDPTSEQRQVGKSANFGLAYGSGAQGLRNYAGTCGITMTIEEAAKIRDTWLSLYAGVAAWIEQCGKEAGLNSAGDKFVLIPETGHRRLLVGDNDRMTVRTNTPVQGAGSAILKVALGNLYAYLSTQPFQMAKLCACVHDEIILLVRDDQTTWWRDKLKEVMEAAERFWLDDVIPCEVTAGIGKTWGSAK
jgi:DNA polymerase I